MPGTWQNKQQQIENCPISLETAKHLQPSCRPHCAFLHSNQYGRSLHRPSSQLFVLLQGPISNACQHQAFQKRDAPGNWAKPISNHIPPELPRSPLALLFGSRKSNSEWDTFPYGEKNRKGTQSNTDLFCCCTNSTGTGCWKCVTKSGTDREAYAMLSILRMARHFWAWQGYGEGRTGLGQSGER